MNNFPVRQLSPPPNAAYEITAPLGARVWDVAEADFPGFGSDFTDSHGCKWRATTTVINQVGRRTFVANVTYNRIEGIEKKIARMYEIPADLI